MNKNLSSIQPDRPKLITPEVEAVRFKRKMDVKKAVLQIIAGKQVIVEELYSNGLEILTQLKQELLLQNQDKSFQEQRDFRSLFREISHRLLLKIKDNKLLAKKSPNIGWLELLYPDISEFYLSFPDVQGMNSAWQWHIKGIEIKTLGIVLHPFYGTYFPTRFDHLQLFDKWLKRYEGKKDNAIDIGVGSGILSFELIQNGFKNVFATDTNKNAIIGVSQECKRLGYKDKIILNHGDLFENCDIKADLIVFNPPWLIAKHKLEEGIDKAIYYEEGLFSRFFEQAKEHLSEEGKVVLIFSNLAQIVDKESSHPVVEELQKNNRFKKALHVRSDVKAASKRTKRTDARAKEKVELWVLAPIKK